MCEEMNVKTRLDENEMRVTAALIFKFEKHL